jgi:inner membrane protein
VTHILTGVCLARSGFNRKAAYATLAMAVAAEFPDIDTLWSLRGPVEGFQHHRGITHTFLGLPLEAAFLVAVVYGVHRVRERRQGLGNTEQGLGASRKAPVRWGWLYGGVLLALLSHLLLDYTNNYGLRPFFPFDKHWYAASIVFIVDPVMLALMAVALVAPWLFGLVGAEVGARRPPFRGRGWAIAALLGIVGWWGLRWVEHGKAVEVGMAETFTQPGAVVYAPGYVPGGVAPGNGIPTEDGVAMGTELPPVYLPAQRALASPDPLNPFHWSVAMDFGRVYQIAEVDSRSGVSTRGSTTYDKPSGRLMVRLAEGSPLGRAYLDWSPMPIVQEDPTHQGLFAAMADAPPRPGETVVTFRDPRFMGGWLREPTRSALEGTVTLDAQGRVVRQTLDGREE